MHPCSSSPAPATSPVPAGTPAPITTTPAASPDLAIAFAASVDTDQTVKPTEEGRLPDAGVATLSDDDWNLLRAKLTLNNPVPFEVTPDSMHTASEEEFFPATPSTPIKGRAKYGPTEGLDEDEVDELAKRYETPVKSHDVTDRINQYAKKHSTYIQAARSSGRPLTHEEDHAARTGRNTPKTKANINHIIASATGQNLLNRTALECGPGGGSSPARAAAVARMQGYSRAIAAERRSETTLPPSPTSASLSLRVRKKAADMRALFDHADPALKQKYSPKITAWELQAMATARVDALRNHILRQTLAAVQSPDKAERVDAYREVLRLTVDSPGNIRVGNSSVNSKISTGFDMPLDVHGRPTEHGMRLLSAHETYAPADLLEEGWLYTRSADGRIPSSSQETTAVAKEPEKPLVLYPKLLELELARIRSNPTLLWHLGLVVRQLTIFLQHGVVERLLKLSDTDAPVESDGIAMQRSRRAYIAQCGGQYHLHNLAILVALVRRFVSTGGPEETAAVLAQRVREGLRHWNVPVDWLHPEIDACLAL